MIPRLDLDGPESLWPTQWPAQQHRSFRTPFEARAPLRKIRVVIDMDTTSHEGTDQWSAARLLAGILRHPYLQVTRFSDTGPPPGSPRLPPPNDQMAKGWVTLADGSAGERGGVDYSVGEHAGCTGYEPDTAAWVARDPNTSYGHLDPTAARQRRDRDGVAMAVAISLTCSSPTANTCFCDATRPITSACAPPSKASHCSVSTSGLKAITDTGSIRMAV